MVKGSPVAVRTLTIQQRRDTIKLSLWKDHSSEDVKPGDWLTAKNVVLSEYQKEKQLSSTSRTTLQVTVIHFDEIETSRIYKCPFLIFCHIACREIVKFLCRAFVEKKVVNLLVFCEARGENNSYNYGKMET